ncbi:MAG: class I SAM-dependent methyltransferase [Oscillospiraceae bacterium]|nr:class I SAM-dependent methyltransferase [Oscillospiraceae bacterium]
MSGYGAFAQFYDELTANVDYEGMADGIEKIFRLHSPERPEIVLDVGCGTGSLALCLARRGYDMIGADASGEMLSCAMEKAAGEETSPLFLCQSAAELDLYGTVQAALCTLDSVNHITDPAELLKAFRRIALFLEPGCLFIFDANTLYKHETILGENTFVYDCEGVYCVWQNSYDPAARLTTIDLDLFEEEGEGEYYRWAEHFSERCWTDDELSDVITQSGMELVACYGEGDLQPPAPNCQRKIFVCRKK